MACKKGKKRKSKGKKKGKGKSPSYMSNESNTQGKGIYDRPFNY